jgi:hypothetical protein
MRLSDVSGAPRRWIRVLPWIFWGAFIVALAAAVAAGLSENRARPLSLLDMLWAASFIGFPTTGALIAYRLPERPLGWMFCIAPLFMMSGVALSEWANWSTTSPDVGPWIAWGANLLFGGSLAIFVVIPFFLPSGNLAPGRWGRVARIAMVVGALMVVVLAFGPGNAEEFPGGRNPAEIKAVAGVLEFAGSILESAALVSLLVAVVSVAARYRRADGIERQQSKWVALGAAAIGLGFGLMAVVEVFVDEIPEIIATPVTIAVILALPATIAIAMLRYRLYDIDVIINRTVVYGVLSAVLVGAYAGGVLLFRTVLDPVTGDNDVAIAASTLAVAALFGPARRSIQTFIDHRFYRSRYDAQRTLEEFATRLRDEIDLNSLSAELLGVVSDTVQPRHASLWIVDEGQIS